MQIVICVASDFCEVKMEKNMSILKKVKRKLYKIFLPMKYARLAGVNFRGGTYVWESYLEYRALAHHAGK